MRTTSVKSNLEKTRFDPVNGDDPFEPDCQLCYKKDKCNHQENPCTSEFLILGEDA